MKTRFLTVFVLAVAMALLALLVLGWTQPIATARSRPAAPHAPPPVPVPNDAHVLGALQGTPLMFVENVGQSDGRARFQVRRGDTIIHVADDALWFTILERGSEEARARQGVNLKLSFPGANPHSRLEPFDRLDTHVSFFRGSDSANWYTDVPAWGGVRYVDLYPGVDLEITSEDGHWAWWLVIRSPQFATSDVHLRVDGADALALEGDALRLSTAVGDFILPLLQAVSTDSTSLTVPRPVVNGLEVIAPFSSPLSSSSSLYSQSGDGFYGTYLGGSGQDIGNDIAIDGDGDAYIAGSTSSTDFPATTGAFSEALNGGGDAFVAKIHPAGQGTNDLVYATYIGGPAGDYATGVAVDGDENAYITGWSNLYFPDTSGSFNNCDGGGAFVTTLNATGTDLLYSGCIVGINTGGQDITLDGSDRAHVSGNTGGNFPTTAGAFQETHGGGTFDAFLAVVSADGSALNYATYLGGNDNECTGSTSGCTLDLDNGSVYLAGDTLSPNFPTTTGAYDTSCGTDGNCDSGNRDAFLVKLDPEGKGQSDLLYSTFIGHSGGEYAAGVAVDGAGNAYLAGGTSSHEFPTTSGAYSEDHNGGYEDAFLLKLNPAGGGTGDLVYSTFLGGGGPGDKGRDIAVDGDGHAYAVGTTNSADFPTTSDGYDISLGGTDGFVVKLDPAGNGQADLLYGTFLGGDNGGEVSYALVVDGSGNVYVTGKTNADDFPTSEGAYDRTYNGGTHDAFMVRLPTQAAQYQIYLPLILRNC